MLLKVVFLSIAETLIRVQAANMNILRAGIADMRLVNAKALTNFSSGYEGIYAKCSWLRAKT
jgi:hypothetical protein